MEYVVFLAVILLILNLPGRTKKYTGNQKYIDRLLKKHCCYQSKHFMTAREREFFRELCRALAGYPLLVMAQVRLVDVVQVCPGFSEAENRRLFRQISQWHCDYVVVDQQDFTVRAIIELDDRSHLRPERQRRDALFNLVVIQAGIPLHRPRSVKQAREVADGILRRV